MPSLCPPGVSRLVRGMLGADPDALGDSAAELAAAGRLGAEAFAREELACAAAAARDRDRASAALDAALTGYQRMGAVVDRDRALARARALGIGRRSRETHRDADFGWESLTVSESMIAALVRDGLTNREIGTRLYVSPRTVQTQVSHILQKTGLRSRVEMARFAGRVDPPAGGCLAYPAIHRFQVMKPLSLILAFLPLIAFSLLSRVLPHGYIGVAGIVSAVIALVAIVTSLPVWPPKILTGCSLVLFTVLGVLGFTLGKSDDRWLATWGGAGVGLVLGLAILILIPVMPFTEQFARESTPQAYWSSPVFKKINRVLSTAWGVAIFAPATPGSRRRHHGTHPSPA